MSQCVFLYSFYKTIISKLSISSWLNNGAITWPYNFQTFYYNIRKIHRFTNINNYLIVKFNSFHIYLRTDFRGQIFASSYEYHQHHRFRFQPFLLCEILVLQDWYFVRKKNGFLRLIPIIKQMLNLHQQTCLQI